MLCDYIREDEENETPAMKQNPERWGREQFLWTLATDVLLR